MKRNDYRQKFADYMKLIRKGEPITIAYNDLSEIEQRCKREEIKIKMQCYTEYVVLKRK